MTWIDPWDIEQFTVFRMDKDLGDGKGMQSKLFVALGHHPPGSLYVLKPTSQLPWYEAQPERFTFSVVYEVGETTLTCFPKKTMIEPHNGWPFPYDEIADRQRERVFAIEGRLPADFAKRLQNAIYQSRYGDGGVLDREMADNIAAALKAPLGKKL